MKIIEQKIATVIFIILTFKEHADSYYSDFT